MRQRIFRSMMLLLLAVMVSVTMLTGCGKDDDDRKKTEDTNDPGGKGNSTVNPTDAEPTREPTATPSEAPVPTDMPTPIPTDTPTPVPTDSPMPISTNTPTAAPSVAPAAALESGRPLYLAIPDNNLNQIAVTLPYSVTVTEHTPEGRNVNMTSNSEKIRELVSAFVKVKVGEYTGNTTQANLNSITFRWQDGSETVISMLGLQIAYNTGLTTQLYTCTDMSELITVAANINIGGVDEDKLVDVVCVEQKFKTKAYEGMPTKYDEDAGLYIGTDPDRSASSPPYALICRWGSNLGVSAVEYLTKYFTPIMKRDYGDNLLEITEQEEFDVQFADGTTKKMYGMAYRYNAAGNTLWLYRIVGEFNGEIVTFSAKFIDGQPWSEDAAMSALEVGTIYFEFTDAQGGGGDDPKEDPKVSVDPKDVVYTTYDNGLITMQVPVGWTVEVHDRADYQHYTFQVYDPKNPDLRVFYNLKYECFASKADYEAYTSVYPKGELATMMWVDECTPESFFETMLNHEQNTGVFTFRRLKNFKRVEVVGKEAVLGGDIVRATCVNENGEKLEGLFSSSFSKVSLFYLYMLYVYQNYSVTAPEGYLDAWTPVFEKILGTMEFTEEMQKKLKE